MNIIQQDRLYEHAKRVLQSIYDNELATTEMKNKALHYYEQVNISNVII